jgi:hypothetical protein
VAHAHQSFALLLDHHAVRSAPRSYTDRMTAGRRLFMCLTIGLQLRYINAIAAAPPVFAVIGFKWYLNRCFAEKVSRSLAPASAT